MQTILRTIGWKRCINISIGVLITLIFLNFYGLYTNKFYFAKIDNYIFPVISIVHFVFLYVLHFKITENELPDPLMRNLEFVLYGVTLVYLFKVVDTLIILMSYGQYENHVIPATFIPMGLLILLLYITLLGLTLLAFKHRKELVGGYNFENLNEHIEPWNR